MTAVLTYGTTAEARCGNAATTAGDWLELRDSVQGAPDAQPRQCPHAGLAAGEADRTGRQPDEQEDRSRHDVGELAAKQRRDVFGQAGPPGALYGGARRRTRVPRR